MKYRNWDEKGERNFRLAILGLLVLVLVSIHFIDPTFYPTVYHLSRDGDLRGTIHYLKSFGMYAAAMSFFIDVVINIVGFLPSIFISTANGLIFGLFWGIIISWLAETTGVLISFYAMRVLFRGMAANIIARSKTLKKLDSYDSWQAMAAARAIPYMPNGLVTAIAALSSMHFRHYALGCLIGKLPSTALEVVLGHDLVHLEENFMRLTVLIILVSLIYGGIWYYSRRRKQKSESSSDKK
ncbi:TVP38/TMEM64 family protein [uncultured Dialister sp.]|uniref:TVP38/TMEM64 family protein n=1 Tax=uncultured Dialister sp. TaxID=278064 RepID=UPI0025E33107|nr:TVP38/TMEM64 family protein [uncultured Dialister sp.]